MARKLAGVRPHPRHVGGLGVIAAGHQERVEIAACPRRVRELQQPVGEGAARERIQLGIDAVRARRARGARVLGETDDVQQVMPARAQREVGELGDRDRDGRRRRWGRRRGGALEECAA